MKAIYALISPLILLTAASTVGKGKLMIDPEDRCLRAMTKRLFYVTAVMSCALGLAGGSGHARPRPAGPNPRHPSMTCAYKTIGVAHDMYNKKQKLSFYYPPTRLVEAMRPKRDYEVFTQPDGEVRISRRFDGVKYNIRFAGGSNLAFIMADGHPLSFNVDTDEEKNYPYGRAAGGEKCGTPDHLIERNVSLMIEDLPLDARQKAELRGYVAVLTFGQPSDLQGLKKVHVETGADPESRKRIIRELNKPELGGSVAKNILATISSGEELASTSISGVDRNFLQHYRSTTCVAATRRPHNTGRRSNLTGKTLLLTRCSGTLSSRRGIMTVPSLNGVRQ